MKQNALWPVAAGLVAALVGFAGLNPYLPGGGDNAEYIAQAQALNESGHRANLHLAGDPEDTFRPPLYPYLLAFLMRICGREVTFFKAVNVLFALGAVAAAWWFLSAALSATAVRQASQPDTTSGSPSAADPDPGVHAGWLTLWFALSPLLLFCAHDVLTDVPYTFVSLLALGCAARVERPRGMRWLAASVMLLVLAMLLRTAAFLLAGALGGYFLLEFWLRRRDASRGRCLVTGTVFVILTAGLFVWVSGAPQTYVGSARLMDNPAAFAARVKDQGALYGISLAGEVVSHDVLWPYFPLPTLPPELCHRLRWWAHLPVVLLVGGVAVWGCVTLWRRRNRLVPVVWVLHMGVLLLWPFFDARFHLPVFPLFLALVWVGARELLSAARNRSLVAEMSATFSLALLPAVCLIGALLSLGDPRPAFMTGLEWGVGGTLLGGTLIWLVVRSERQSVGRRLATLLTGVVLGLALLRTVDQNFIRERQWGPALPDGGWQEFHAAAQAVRERAAPDEVVASAKTSLVWFWTGLKGIPVPATTDPAEGLTAIARARWAIVDDLQGETEARRYLLPLLERDRKRWEPLMQIPSLDGEGRPVGRSTLIYRRRD